MEKINNTCKKIVAELKENAIYIAALVSVLTIIEAIVIGSR